MPKLFPISIEVEELFVGRVMRQLNGMSGVAKINLDIERRVKKPNGIDTPNKRFEQKAEDFIAELLMKHPMPTSVLRQHFADVGRRPGSTSSALNVMKSDGTIKKDKDGKTWVLTAKAKDRMRHRKNK